MRVLLQCLVGSVAAEGSRTLPLLQLLLEQLLVAVEQLEAGGAACLLELVEAHQCRRLRLVLSLLRCILSSGKVRVHMWQVALHAISEHVALLELLTMASIVWSRSELLMGGLDWRHELRGHVLVEGQAAAVGVVASIAEWSLRHHACLEALVANIR